MLKHFHRFYDELQQDGVMFCFSGPTSQNLVVSIGQALKRKMELEQVGMNTIQRVFSIFVELTQNIVNHSLEEAETAAVRPDEVKPGIVVVGRHDERFYVICGNKVCSEQGEKMLRSIETLRRMDKQELKEQYRLVRRRPLVKDGKGAGLGLIEMFRRASEPLECHMSPIGTGMVFFTIKAIG